MSKRGKVTKAEREAWAAEPRCGACHHCGLSLRCPIAHPWNGETHAIAGRWEERFKATT
jgi:hypothetical protein